MTRNFSPHEGTLPEVAIPKKTSEQVKSAPEQVQDILQKPLDFQKTEGFQFELNTLLNKRNQDATKVFQVSHERINEVNQSLTNVTVTHENFNEVQSKISSVLGEGNLVKQYPTGSLRNAHDSETSLDGNISLAVGDKFIWNQKDKVLMVLDYNSQTKFFISFVPDIDSHKDKLFTINTEKTEATPLIPTNLSSPQQADFGKSFITNSGFLTSENPELNPGFGKALNDFIARRWPFNGGRNSCGASVGSLLNQFGLRGVLPQSGRDGKNWDTILERYASNFFRKVPVDFPDNAPDGSVLVFNEWALRWSRARKRHGHVEIKSNGTYVSYYRSVNPGGSARAEQSGDPADYRRQTGFTGYAYVYTGPSLST